MHYVEVKSIVSAENRMNIYRGCTHGCIYCDSRSNCYSFKHNFEDIEIKENAIELLDQTLRRKRKKAMISTGAMTDPYIHLEEKIGNTRKSLEIIYKYSFGVNVLTKSTRLLKDLDILKKINKKTKCVVHVSMSTYDEALCKIIEPNVSTTKERFEMLKILNENNIPTIVWLMPFLPFINDNEENINGLLNYCKEANVHGILSYGIGLTLRDGNREYFYKQIDKSFPNMSRKYEKAFGGSYSIDSPHSKELMGIIREYCKENNMLFGAKAIFSYSNEFPEQNNYEQMSLF